MARPQARLKTLGGPDELDPTGVTLVIIAFSEDGISPRFDIRAWPIRSEIS